MTINERLGNETEMTIIKALVEEPLFINTIYPIINKDMFVGNEKANQAIVVQIMNYYKENKQAPTWNGLELIIKNSKVSKKELEKLLPTLLMIRNHKILKISEVKDVAIRFFQEKQCVKIMNTINDNITLNKNPLKTVDEITKICETIRKAEVNDVFDCPITDENIISSVMQNDTQIVPTGIKDLDELIGGGVRKTEVGLFIAPTGYGKTTLSTVFAAGAYNNHFNVLQIYFEDNKDDMIRKHISLLSGREQYQLKGHDEQWARSFTEMLNKKEPYQNMKTHLKLVKMKDGDTTIENIIDKINNLKDDGFYPDLVIIDYFDCLKHSENPTKDFWQAQARCMRKIVDDIAFNFNCAVWVFQQTNRGGASADSDKKTPFDKIQGSYQIVQPCTVFLELRRSAEQFEKDRADIVIGKSRHAKRKGNLNNITFNNGTCFIDTSEAITNEKDLEYYE